MLSLLKQERALFFTSLFGIFLLLMRIQYLGGPCKQGWEMIYCPSMRFLFLCWNLFLAWIPLFIAYLLSSISLPKWLVGISIFTWLLFFPNAPYLITDLIHLQPREGIPLWYDAFLLFCYAYLGIWLAIRALQKMRLYISAHWGHLVSKFFIGATIALSGLGIYLGRVERWNSWDLFTHPEALFKSIFHLLSNPLSHPQAYLMMGVTSVLLSLMYWLSLKPTNMDLKQKSL